MCRGSAQNARSAKGLWAAPSCKPCRPALDRSKIAPRDLSPGCIQTCFWAARQQSLIQAGPRPLRPKSYSSPAQHHKGSENLAAYRLYDPARVVLPQLDRIWPPACLESAEYRCRIFVTLTLRPPSPCVSPSRVGPHREDGLL